jgi:hypothetical protein
VDDCWWLNSLAVDEEAEFYDVVHFSGEGSPVYLQVKVIWGLTFRLQKPTRAVTFVCQPVKYVL